MPANERPRDSRPPALSTQERVALLAIVLLGLALRFVQLGRFSLWLDEAASREFTLYGFSHAIASEMNHPPLYRIVLYLATRLMGESEWALRFPSALFSTLAIPAVHRLATVLRLKPPVRLLAALIAATSPFEILLAQEARHYPLILLITALHLASWARLVGSGENRSAPVSVWMTFATTAFLGLHTFYLFGLVLVGELVAALRIRAPALKPLLLTFAALALLYLPWTIQFLTAVGPQHRDYIGALWSRVPAWIFRTTVGNSLAIVNYPPPADPVAFALAHIPEALVFLLAVPGPLLSGALALARDRGREARSLVIVWAAPPAALALGFGLVPLFHERYLSFLTPLFDIALAVGFFRMKSRIARVAVPLAFAGLVLASLRNYYLLADDSRYGREQWREAAAIVAAGRRPGDVIALHKPYLDIAWNYYFDRENEGGTAPLRLPAGEGTLGDLPPESAEAITRAKRVWLVLAHTWDTGDAWRKALREFGEERREVILPLSHGIRIYLFERLRDDR
jgi:4-amino-4-deoxy-L-arabinose transferase-like glycosyltransferase